MRRCVRYSEGTPPCRRHAQRSAYGCRQTTNRVRTRSGAQADRPAPRLADAGQSGAKGRDQRSGLDGLPKDASRRKFDVVMVWAIDRLSRSLVDLLGTIQHLEVVGQQSTDTTPPAGKLSFQMTAAFAQFERSMIRQRVRAGLSVIKAKIERDGKLVSKAGRGAETIGPTWNRGR